MSASFYELLKYAKTGIASPEMTLLDCIRAQKLSGGSVPIATITGLPPIDFISDGTPLTAWSISGNMAQTGDAPITPQECGDPTPNLCDVSNSNKLTYNSSYDNYTIDDDEQTVTTSGNVLVGFLVPVDVSTTYTVYAKSTEYGMLRIREYSAKPSSWDGAEYIQQTINNQCGYAYNFTTTATTKWICVAFYFESSHSGAVISNIMLNAGSTAIDYEPYGYKILISCAGQTVPVYLGQTQTVRRVKKIVLTGTENWNDGTSNYYIFTNVSGRGEGIPNSATLSTHTESGVVVNNNGTALFFRKLVFVQSSLADFKDYLAQQYANGTPVTVWYVLAEPTTGIVNEPLCKIGDYADELHSEDAGVSIPTVKGQNTLTVDTDLQPSSVSITGHISE